MRSHLRALAHPTRLALLELLQVHPSLTATEASELIDVSPTNCAFHLRALGRFGFVEEVGGGAGRRRPWRIANAPTSFSDVDEGSYAFSDVLIRHWLDRIKAAQAQRHTETVEWQEVLGCYQSVVFGSLGEVAELVQEMRALLSRYDDRLKGPRPDDSRPIELLLFAQPFDRGQAY